MSISKNAGARWLGAILVGVLAGVGAGAPSAVPVVGALCPIQELAATVSGRVLGPGGAPVAGAVVVSSAGGGAVSAADGSFELALDLAAGQHELSLTAVGSGGRLAHAPVALTAPGRTTLATPLTLAMGTSCDPAWLPTFGTVPGMGNTVSALEVYDDGGGPALYATGWFLSAGGVPASRIAKWDGSAWAPLGAGLNGAGFSLAVYDEGTGPALYVGGDFTTAGGQLARNIAKWDGVGWSLVGTGGPENGSWFAILSLEVYDLGTGPVLFLGGELTNAEGTQVRHIAQWDGQSWSDVGGGVEESVRTMIGFDDGSGPALYVNGSLPLGGGMYLDGPLKWDGVSWSAVGGGLAGTTKAMAVYDDGSGAALYVGGGFTLAGGSPAHYLAKWDGVAWSAVGGGMNDRVSELAVFDDGHGPALFAFGDFTAAGGVPADGCARWDGASWVAIGDGFSSAPGSTAVFDDGSGPALFVGGSFLQAGGALVNCIARLGVSGWDALGGGGAPDDTVWCLGVYDDGGGGGPMLYASGSFEDAGGLPVNSIARWDGASWSDVGGGLDLYARAMEVFDDGDGPRLYVGGGFTAAGGEPVNHIARWDGTSWERVGGGVNSSVLAFEVFDDGGGPALYVGGGFDRANGNPSPAIARFDATGWSSVGGGLTNPPADDSKVDAMAVYDDGTGPALYASGRFDLAGGVPARRIARWDGTSWSPLGDGLVANTRDMAVFDDGGGPALYVGGHVTSAGGVPVQNIARWDGGAWSGVGPGFDGFVQALEVFDAGDGLGAQLYAAGSFLTSGGAPMPRIARWDGLAWNPVGPGLNSSAFALEIFDDGSGAGPGLYVAGGFETSSAGDSHIARWGGCPETIVGVPYCFGDGSGAACPCANAGGPGRGCASSVGAGAELAASGSASIAADDLILSATHLVPGQPTLLFSGANELDSGDGVPFGDGLRCAGGGVLRHGVRTPDAGGSASWGPGLASSAGWSAGEQRRFQAWYRDPAGPCASGFNLSNGFEVVFGP